MNHFTPFAFVMCVVGLLITSSFSIAEISALNEQLNRLLQERVDYKKQLESEKLIIADEILKLNNRSTEIDEELKKNQTEATLDFQLMDLKDLMTKSMGQCQIQVDSAPFTYLIIKENVQIRFSLQDIVGDVIGKISRKTVGLNSEVPVVELTLEPRYPDGHEATQSAALIRFNPETLEVVHATFTGLRVNDKLLGLGNSLSLHQLVCEL